MFSIQMWPIMSFVSKEIPTVPCNLLHLWALPFYKHPFLGQKAAFKKFSIQITDGLYIILTILSNIGTSITIN